MASIANIVGGTMRAGRSAGGMARSVYNRATVLQRSSAGRRVEGAMTKAAMAGLIGGGATIGAIGMASSLEGGPSQGNPWTAFNAVNTASYAGSGAGIGGLAGAFAGRMRGKGMGKLGMIGAAVGAAAGAMYGMNVASRVNAGAYTGGPQGSMAPETRMSPGVRALNTLRNDISRLHRPIKGTGW